MPTKVKPMKPIPVKPVSSGVEGMLKDALGGLVTAKYAAQGAHWNVEGRDFGPFHSLFGDFYEMLDGLVDPTAEWLRKLNAQAPSRLEEFRQSSVSSPSISSKDGVELARSLHGQVKELVSLFERMDKAADEAGYSGLCNFLQGALDETLSKIEWQLRVTVA